MKQYRLVLARILAIIIVLPLLMQCTKSAHYLQPPALIGGPVRVTDAASDRLYFLSSQWEKRYFSTSRSRTVSWLHLDLWTLDAATAQPLSRRRIKRDKAYGDLAAMGVEQGVLWARIPELVGIRLSDGQIVADSAGIEARNPGLKGLMPKPPDGVMSLPESMQPARFSAATGLVILLADARRVRIDARTLAATPVSAQETEHSTKLGDVSGRIEINSLSNGTDWNALVRSLTRDRQWLGLLAEEELEELRARHFVNDSVDYSVPRRLRLYRAEQRPVESFFGTSLRLFDPVLLPESPELIMAGLLTAAGGRWEQKPAMWHSDPDSVFVLSRDRLGEDGHLQLARIAGADGHGVWSTALPLSQMHAWLPAERHALMLGPDPAVPQSPMAAMARDPENPAMQIVSVDLLSGDLRSFNLDLHRDWPVDGDSR